MTECKKSDIVVTLGMPESGRTTYLALIAGNLLRHFRGDERLEFGLEGTYGSAYAKRFPMACASGRWPHEFVIPSPDYSCDIPKTYREIGGVSFEMHFTYETEPDAPNILKPFFPNCKHIHGIDVVDIESQFCLYSKLISDPVTTGKLRDLVAKSDHILLFVDSEKFCQNAPEVRDSVIGCMHVLQQRILERKDPLHIGVVMSKGDLLQTDPHYFHDGNYDMGRLRWRFMELFQDLIPQHNGNIILYEDVQIEYDFFCVSSIHEAGHRYYDHEINRWMPQAWQLRDMNGQLWPLLWSFERLGLPLHFFSF